MDKFTASRADNALTLAFEKAATQETKIFHPWRYFVAGGETLAKIQEFIADVANVAQEKEDFKNKIGAKKYNGTYGIEFDFDQNDMLPLSGTERVDYHLNGGNGSEPWQAKRIASVPDFIVSDGRTYGQFHPDVSTPRGRAIRDEMQKIEEKAQPSKRFAQWLGAANVDVPRNPAYSGDRVKLSAIATKIGDEWIVAVPVEIVPDPHPQKSYTETWIVPPDAAPLSVGEYFTRVEKNNLLKNTTKAPKA